MDWGEILSNLPSPPTPNDGDDDGPPSQSQLVQEIVRRHAPAAVKELERRQKDALKLFQVTKYQQGCLDCKAQTKLYIGPNRSGKTTMAGKETSTIARGLDPRFPKPGRIAVVGQTLKSLGQVIYRILFQPGAFSILRDPDTGEWRAARGCDDFPELHRPAPPFIPPSAIDDIGYYDRKLLIPTRVKLKSGWDIWFFSSEGIPNKGDRFHFVWMDEEPSHPGWYDEVAVRGTADFRGSFIWSCTPQLSSEDLVNCYENAQDPDLQHEFRAFQFSLEDNPFIHPDEKTRLKNTWRGTELLVRYYGVFSQTPLITYGQFKVTKHVCKEMRVPEDWTRYMAVDPGCAVAAAVFLAVDPKGNYHVYDEVYCQRADPDKFAHEVSLKAKGQFFQDFIIDGHGARLRGISDGKLPLDEYERAFKAAGLRCRAGGSTFRIGDSNIRRREVMLRAALDGKDGKCIFFYANCTRLIKTMPKQCYKVDKNGVVIEERANRDNHLVDCVEYIVAESPAYVGRSSRRAGSEVLDEIRELEAYLGKGRGKDDPYVVAGSRF